MSLEHQQNFPRAKFPPHEHRLPAREHLGVSKKRTEIVEKCGDATRPDGDGPRIIVHVCNDIGAWGSGFVMSLSRVWREPERRYRAWSRGREGIPFELGEVQFVEVEPKLWVANMIGQRDIRSHGGVPPVRYGAIKRCLQKVADFAITEGGSVHMPFIASDRAGGSWAVVKGIISEQLCEKGIPVTAYKLGR